MRQMLRTEKEKWKWASLRGLHHAETSREDKKASRGAMKRGDQRCGRKLGAWDSTEYKRRRAGGERNEEGSEEKEGVWVADLSLAGHQK